MVFGLKAMEKSRFASLAKIFKVKLELKKLQSPKVTCVTRSLVDGW